MQNYLDKIASLTPETRRIICDKATERPHSGTYEGQEESGSYLCRRCGLALFRSKDQFHSGCGWPSFDAEVLQTVQQIPDKDGKRTEIICARCKAHLGHIFTGEHFTEKNIRHCVNSASLDFVSDSLVLDSEEIIVAGGCFWGIEHFMRELPGVLSVEVGYTGGTTVNPNYEQVCQGKTGHLEAARIVYDKLKTNAQRVLQHFFEIHDPTQNNGQGPDIGEQYQSAVFYYNEEQKKITEKLIEQLKHLPSPVMTKVFPVQNFWPAENYHQNYYRNHRKLPYCHKYTKRFP